MQQTYTCTHAHMHTLTHSHTCSVNTEELECAPVLWQRKFGRGGRRRVSSGQVHSAVGLQQGEVFSVLIFLKGQQPVDQSSTCWVIAGELSFCRFVFFFIFYNILYITFLTVLYCTGMSVIIADVSYIVISSYHQIYSGGP